MLVTKDGRKAGKTEWVARIWRWEPNSEEDEFLGGAAFPNMGLAKAWVKRRIRPGDNATIEVGTYEPCEIHDEAYGHILDASWEPNYDQTLSTFAEQDGSFVWVR